MFAERTTSVLSVHSTTTKETTMKFTTIFCSLLGLVGVGFGIAYLPSHSQSTGDLTREAYAVQDAETSTTKPEKVEGEFGTLAPNGGTYLGPGVSNPAGETTSEIWAVNLPGETMIEIGVGNQPVVPEPAPQVEETPDEDSWVDMLDVSDEEKAEMVRRSKRSWLGIAEDIEAAAARAQRLQMAYGGDGGAAYNNGTLNEFNRALGGLAAVSNSRGAARFARKLHELYDYGGESNDSDFERTYRMYLRASFGPNWGNSAVQSTMDSLQNYILLGPGHSIFNKVLDDSVATIRICIE